MKTFFFFALAAAVFGQCTTDVREPGRPLDGQDIVLTLARCPGSPLPIQVEWHFFGPEFIWVETREGNDFAALETSVNFGTFFEGEFTGFAVLRRDSVSGEGEVVPFSFRVFPRVGIELKGSYAVGELIPIIVRPESGVSLQNTQIFIAVLKGNTVIRTERITLAVSDLVPSYIVPADADRLRIYGFANESLPDRTVRNSILPREVAIGSTTGGGTPPTPGGIHVSGVAMNWPAGGRVTSVAGNSSGLARIIWFDGAVDGALKGAKFTELVLNITRLSDNRVVARLTASSSGRASANESDPPKFSYSASLQRFSEVAGFRWAPGDYRYSVTGTLRLTDGKLIDVVSSVYQFKIE